MKVNRPHLNHKTDRGGVLLGIDGENGVREAFFTLQKAAGQEDVEILIQEMAGPGLEVIVGGRRDAVFGPVILFGLGGILVEALGDAVWRVAPVDCGEAARMLDRIHGRRLLDGVRGGKPRDREAVVEGIARVSRLMTEFPAILEMDVNPLLALEQGKGAPALDARVILNPGAIITSD